MTRDPRRNAGQPDLETDADFARAMADWNRLALVEPEPVRPVERSGNVIVWLAAGLLIGAVAAVILAAVATSRSAPDPAQSGTPQMADVPHPATATWIRPKSSQVPAAVLPPAGVLRGWATHCKPTPTHCQNWGGKAMLGAVPTFRWGDDRYLVQVCGFEGGTTSCVHVTVVSYCACGDRRGIPTVIDLSPYAFRQLAPLGRGVIRVEVSGPIHIPLPATDSDTGGAP